VAVAVAEVGGELRPWWASGGGCPWAPLAPMEAFVLVGALCRPPVLCHLCWRVT
jgi:hypothetical protein